MDDSRLITAKECLYEVLLELENDNPDTTRIRDLLKQAHGHVVDLVDGGISSGASRADLNQLDSAATFINRCMGLLGSPQPREWVFAAMEQFTGHAIDHLQVVLSGNVIPLNRSRATTRPGGAA